MAVIMQRAQDKKLKHGDIGNYPGGPVVKNLPSNAGDADWITGRRTRSHMLRGN